MAANQETSLLTVAAIRKGRGQQPHYLFHERQRIYTLNDKVSADTASVRRLDAARDKRELLKVALDLRNGTILRIAEPTAAEVEAFTRERVPLAKPDKVVAIEVDEIDPTTFNFVDLYLKWKAFKLCEKVVPTYAKAKQIFDFCAQLSCNLPGPYAITPCIPFQYVRDGCYARAHQMRRIITTKYGYCCDKVFSFANQNDDELAVKADKWGGCCVTWWYHVAPLIRVRFKLKGFAKANLELAMVIDPGMFDKPVLLSTWLSAQQSAACSAHAHVSMYSIQPGTAYWPTSYDGTTYGTDPNYTLTEQTLIDYSGLTTCP